MRNNDESKSFNYFPIGGDDDSDSGNPFEDFQFPGADDGFGDDEPCWMFKSIATLMGMPKPFGMIFPYEKEKDFLEKRGYEVKELKCSKSVSPLGVIRIAVKSGTKINKKDIEALQENYSVSKVFTEEVQNIILGWLLKIGGEL